MVKSWLIKSLNNSLVGSFINCSTAREVWEAFATTFFDGNDSAQYHNRRCKTYNLRQGDSSIKTYYKECKIYGERWTIVDPILLLAWKILKGITK
jgi:hypothetical protein